MAPPKIITPEKFYDVRAARAEGWEIATGDDGVFRLKPIDATAPAPACADAKRIAFAGDDDVWEHVTAKAWAGSPNHDGALQFIERFAPEEFLAMRNDALLTASASYRVAERQRFFDNEKAVIAILDGNALLKAAAATAYNDLILELHNRRIDVGAKPKQFEAHHENMVAREAFLLALHDTKDPDHATTLCRRRMLLTATPHDFFGQMLPQPQQEMDDTPTLH